MSERLALFLGAGASRFIEMPTTIELMDEIKEWVKGREKEPHRSKTVQNLAVRIVEDKTYTDIEKLYDAIDDVIRLTENTNCKPIVDKTVLSDSGSINLKNFIPELKEMRAHIREMLLDKFVINSHEYDKPILQMYGKLLNIISGVDVEGFKIFTTNYDMVIETLAYERRFELVTGFKEDGRYRSVWAGGTVDSWKPQSTRIPLYLTKLHGSVNWYRDSTNRIIQSGDKGDAEKSIMIAPTEGRKDYTVDPFPTLLKRFEEDLETVETLIVIGFSFRDADIVKIIRDKVNNGMSLVALSPSVTDDIKKKVDGVRVTDKPFKPLHPETHRGFTSKVMHSTEKYNVILCQCKFSLDDTEWENALDEALHL